MKNIIIIILLTSISAYAQPNQVDEKIYAVENHLMTRKQYLDTNYNYHSLDKPGFNLQDRMHHYHIPAVAIAVIHDGKLAWTRTYGLIETTLKVPATDTTRFTVASVSKSLNAFCIMKLAEQGKLDLNKDIRDYLKTWKFPDNKYSNGKNITLINLLSHTAGTSLHSTEYYTPGEPLPTLNEILDGKKPAKNHAVRPIAEPKEALYSGGGIVISRKILEDNVAKDYDSLMNEIVFKPLQMHSSTYKQVTSTAFQPSRAPGYNKTRKIKGNYNISVAGPGGLWTTAGDLAKFIISIQHSLKGEGSVLGKEMTEKMLTPVVTTNGRPHAPGFLVMNFGNESYFNHDGADPGNSATFFGSTQSGVGLVIITNSEMQFEFMYEIWRSVQCVYQWSCYKKW